MKIRIAHARSSETGTIDGQAGDQTGREVMISDITTGWKHVIRACDPGQRIYIAAYAAQIAANDNIGYSQKTRLGLYEAWEAAGRDFTKIRKKCNCDCSSMVACCVIASGTAISKDMYTGNELDTLVGSGAFVTEVFSEKRLKRGDILLKPGHTAIVVETDQINYQDKIDVQCSTYADFKDTNLSGLYAVKEKAYVRDGGGLGYAAIGVLDKYTTVACYGFYTKDERGVKWLLIESGYIGGIKYTGFMSEKVIAREVYD